MNKPSSTHVIMLCFSCSRLRLIPVSACESQIQLRTIEIVQKNKRPSVMDSLFVFLSFFYLAQSLAKLVRTGCRSVSASDAFQLRNDIFHLHSLDQCPDSLKVSITASPEEKFGHDTVFHFQFDVAAASSLRLVSQFLYHYSSAGFMLV